MCIVTIVSIWFDGDEIEGDISSNYYTFQGRRNDPEAELMFYRQRYYSPQLGRFVGRDPLAETHLYRYGQNPIGYIDPLGLRESCCPEAACTGLQPTEERINKHVNDMIRNSSYKDAETAWNLLSGAGRLAFWKTAIELWIEKNFSSNEFRYYDPLGSYATKRFINAPCISICNRCIGIDKLGHFFQQGYMMYEISKKKGRNYALAFSAWTEGYSLGTINTGAQFEDMSAEEFLDIRQWLRSGEFEFKGFSEALVLQFKNKWGGNEYGPPSPSDMAANASGMTFWTLLSQGGFGFRMNESKKEEERRKFDICDPEYGVNTWWEDPQRPRTPPKIRLAE